MSDKIITDANGRKYIVQDFRATEPERPTLRDQMAMAAVPEILRRGYEAGLPLANIATGAYSMADAMLAARSAKGEK